LIKNPEQHQGSVTNIW